MDRPDKKLYDAVLEVPAIDYKEIVDKAVQQAKNGNPKARQWLTELLLASNNAKLNKLFEEIDFPDMKG